MEYIILDMEWNQPWPGSYAAQRPLPIHISGEIIQIGAVRMSEDQKVLDEFQCLIRPRFFRRLNSRVSKLTGIKESRLRAEGLSFDDAINEFYNWVGDDPVFLTWGFDAAPQEMRTQTTVPGLQGTPREMCTYWVEIGQKAVQIGSESVAFGACAASKGTTWSRLCRS